MKAAAKVFIILSLCLTVCAFIISFVWSVITFGLSVLIILVLGLPGFITGCVAINKLNYAIKKDQLIGVGICTLLFCSLLGGIFVLCVSDESLEENRRKIGYYTNPERQGSINYQTANIEFNSENERISTSKQIAEIKREMKEKGFSSMEEYKKYLIYKIEKEQVEKNEHEEIIKLRNELYK